MTWSERPYPILLAVLVTLLNVAKPAVVDDTAYLFFAGHLSNCPLDPYGFQLFWYAEPQPAMQILLPPLLPYWLALGMALFGDQLFVLKLWLFPFAWVLCESVYRLMRRFAPGATTTGTAVFVLSPAVLPLFNVMLDVPAVAFGAAAVTVFVMACDERRIGLAVLAGVLTGLAMQTKYSMLVTPAVLGWYALTRPHRAVLNAVIAVGLAVILFAGWEWCLYQKYRESHFLYHLRGQADPNGVMHSITEKLGLVRPLLSHFGLVAVGVSLWASRAAGFGPAVQWVAVGIGVVGICVLAAVSESRLGDSLPEVAFFIAGISIVVTLALAVFRLYRELTTPTDRRALAFLVGWVVLEAVASVALTPFAAARRVMGVTLALAALAAFVVSRLGATRWTAGLAVWVGLAVAAIDWWDAYPEKATAMRAAEVTDPRHGGGTVWFNGHWGFQYYCQKLGMVPVEPGRSRLRAGDRLVVPLPPPGVPVDGFYRPHHGWAIVRIDPERTELIEVIEWDDPIRLTTLPSLYGGGVPMRGRDGPRVRLGVYRVTAEWVP